MLLTRLTTAGIDEAHRKYVDLRGNQHNPFFPAGFPALQKTLNHKTPGTTLDYLGISREQIEAMQASLNL